MSLGRCKLNYSSFLPFRFSASSIAALSVCGSDEAGHDQSISRLVRLPLRQENRIETLTSKHPTSLERTLQISFSRLSQNVNCHWLRLIQVLETHQRLDEERLRVSIYMLKA